jgi:serine/threonine protein kinase
MTSCDGVLNLKRQMKAMERVSSESLCHVNVVQLFEVYHSPTHILFRMEHAGSSDLHRRLVHRDKHQLVMSPSKTADVVRHCLRALCHLHIECQVAHRDIKPENIIVSETDREFVCKISDFDCAMVCPRNLLCWGCVGTAPFMAPEVAQEHEHSPLPADVWSLAQVFLEVMTHVGVLMRLRLETMIEIFENPNAVDALFTKCLREDLRSMSSDMCRLLTGMLQIIPLDRCDAAELVHVEQELLSDVA